MSTDYSHSWYTYTNGNETLSFTIGCDHVYGPLFKFVLGNASRRILQGNITGPNASDGKTLIPTAATNQFTFAFSNSENIPTTMYRVATAITNQMRGTSNITISGKASSVEALCTSEIGVAYPVSIDSFGRDCNPDFCHHRNQENTAYRYEKARRLHLSFTN